ncbi:MAG: xanthine dehydrogenase family protein molybdopterin-binding subunit [Pseudomonadota bacterium]
MRRCRFNNSRRQFLIKSLYTGAGLTLGIHLSGCAEEEETAAQTAPGIREDAPAADTIFEPNAFVRIKPDNTVTVIIKHLEMGQGTYTGLATLVAEELDADWSQIVAEGAPANAKLYNNLFWGQVQGTGGSNAIANSYEQMRQAGAAARYMLVQAAAKKWQVPEDEITVVRGVLRHEASGNQAGFGELADLAAQQPVPGEVFIKEPEDFTLIGSYVPRKDSKPKVNGSAVFTQDIQLPDMLVAVVAHPPRFGARVNSFNPESALNVKNVEKVVEIPTGVAVLAKDTWSAMQGRDRLQVEWDESQAMSLGSSEIMADYKQRAEKPGKIARKTGDSAAAMASAAATLEAEFHFPFLAHATMEPLNCVVQRTADGVEIWNGVQSQTADQNAVAKLFGIEPEQVKINMLYAGGSFGRRGNPHSDYVLEAANIVKAGDLKVPVKMVWTREDDMHAGYFRPMYYHKMSAGLDEAGKPVAWQHRIVGQSIMAGTAFAGSISDGIDPTSVEGAENMPYAVPNMTVDLITTELKVPVQWWRSVGSTHTAFAVETFIDRLARSAGQDPLEYRRMLLSGYPRHLGVLNLAAEKAGWGEPMKEGRARGVAVHKSFNSYVAEVAEVTLHDEKSFSVDKVVIAVDCGVAVNPDVIRAQMEGGMGYGLSPTLLSEITLEKGAVKQSNFNDYRMINIGQMPKVEVHIVKSAEPPTGVGEPATPVIAPAVANALTSLTGERFDRLPLRLKA